MFHPYQSSVSRLRLNRAWVSQFRHATEGSSSNHAPLLNTIIYQKYSTLNHVKGLKNVENLSTQKLGKKSQDVRAQMERANQIIFQNFLQYRSYASGPGKRYRLVKHGFEYSIGIRAEDDTDQDAWERRTPLTPKHVAELISQGIDVYVESSKTRCYSDEEYREVGAKVVESLAHVNTIFGISAIPPHKLYPDKTYVYVSGIQRGENLKSLDRILENNIRLIDYDKIVNSNGDRLVRFGRFGGIAAAIDTFHALGERLLVENNLSTPFINVSTSKNYSSLQKAEDAIKEVGVNIDKYGLPAALFPFTITITGNGNVSKGIQHVLNMIPHKIVNAEELAELYSKKKHIKEGDIENHFLYVCILDSSHTMRKKVKDNKPFDKEHFKSNPDQYESIFRKFLPYTKVWFNATRWDSRYPRLITTQEAQELLRDERLPLIAITDLSAEPEGSCGFLPKTSTLSEPYYIYNLRKGKATNFTARGEGILISSIENWPAGFPRSSSMLFGEKLLSYVKPIAASNINEPIENQLKVLPKEIQGAIIAANNKYMPKYKKLEELKLKLEKETVTHEAPKKVLLLGSGLVTGPIVEYLMRFPFIRMTIAGNDEEAAIRLCKDYGGNRAQAISLDVRNQEKLEDAISKHDLVLSLVPAPMHPPIAKACIKHGKSMMTASYISPQMKELDEDAKKNNVLIVNELGLDPGIDHMEVFHILDEVKQKKGKVVSFQSYCGALPAPEFSDNPFGYKFSWSPSGVIAASQNSAIYKEAGNVKEVDGQSLMFSAVPLVKKATFAPGFAFETVPNRDSLKYIDFYGFDSDHLRTMIRGTLRYPGFCNMFRCLKVLGLLDNRTRIEFFGGAKSVPWRSILIDLTGAPENITNEEFINYLVDRICKLLKEKFRDLRIKQTDAEILAGARSAVTGLIKLGMFDPKEIIHQEEELTLMKATCNLFSKKLVYREDERDMIFMHHEFIIEYPNGKERISSTLCVYGEEHKLDGFSATAKTVGYPLAMGAELFLRGQLSGLSGVIGPTVPDIYTKVLQLLEKEGITSRKTRSSLFLDEYFDE